MKPELASFLASLNLQKHQDAFTAGGLETVEDLKGLERQDFIDLGLNMAERSRLATALKERT